MDRINLYNILGVSPDCTTESIHKAFIFNSKKVIQDDVKITEKYKPEFEIISLAHDTLIDPIKRKTYDDYNNIHKDTSKYYKSSISCNAQIYDFLDQGYEIAKMKILSEKIPHTGDRFCNKSANLGTRMQYWSTPDGGITYDNDIRTIQYCDDIVIMNNLDNVNNLDNLNNVDNLDNVDNVDINIKIDI
jgi:curved DNA-binding protein CbpA